MSVYIYISALGIGDRKVGRYRDPLGSTTAAPSCRVLRGLGALRGACLGHLALEMYRYVAKDTTLHRHIDIMTRRYTRSFYNPDIHVCIYTYTYTYVHIHLHNYV